MKARRVLIALAAAALGALGWYWFRPERLFVNVSVNEAAIASPAGGAAAQPVWSGTFHNLAHPTTGTAAVYATNDGAHALRLTNFRTSNGPDVRVYLVAGTDATRDEVIQQGQFVDLGALKGNIGDQNYAVPAEVDLARYQAVSIWCRRFSANFGATSASAAAGAPTASAAIGE